MSILRIDDLLEVRGRFMRSTNLERDFGDAGLQDYIVTPQSRAMLTRIAFALSANSRQRAWRITGDYGTGKSSFAVALARLLGSGGRPIPAQLRNAVDFRQLGISRPSLVPLLVTGAREPISVAVLRSLERTLAESQKRGKRPRVLNDIRQVLCSPDSPAVDGAVIDLLAQTSAHICSSGRGTGLLVVLDELGKFLEFAALHPERQDIFLLQRLAEAAARSGRHPLLIVGVLHQGFSAYAEQLSQATQKEWEKVAGRYEELPFSQPLEQTAGLVARALNVRLTKLPSELARSATKEMSRTLDLGWYGPAATRPALLESAPQLYPLHPTVVPVLIRLFARFGQNERSLFSFLLSDEPYALRDFASRPLRDFAFYRIHNLYDYARASFGSSLNVNSYRSHWSQVESVIDGFPRDHVQQLNVLKTVAVLSLVDHPSLLATEDGLCVAAGTSLKNARRRVSEALRQLRDEQRLLYDRGAGGYCLWPHTSVNIEKAYKNAASEVVAPLRISPLIHASLETRPLVARRHYIETGNLRHFAVRYASAEALPSVLSEKSNSEDGSIIVLLCDTEEERNTARSFGASGQMHNRPDILVAVSKPLGALIGPYQECQRWEWLFRNVPELNNDSYAAEEVSRQLAASRVALERMMRRYVGFSQFAENGDLEWFHRGSAIPARSGRELLSALSQICDEMYCDAPRIRNELVNRRALSSAAAAARMRLIERTLRYPTQPFLGMDPTKKPPEMSIYLSVLQNTGLHCQSGEEWRLVAPSPSRDASNLAPVFRHILTLLTQAPERRVRVSEIFAQMRGRPFGVRDGLAPLLLAVFAAVHEKNLAFYEGGAFLRHLSGQEFLRLIKDPDSFEAQYCQVSGVRGALFTKLLRLLHPEAAQLERPELLDIVRPLCLFAAQLPAFTHRTHHLSSEAVAVREALLHAEEPAALVFSQLPAACGFEAFRSDGPPADKDVHRFIEVLRRTISELGAAYPDLQARMSASIAAAFDRPGDFPAVRASIAEVAGTLLGAIAEPRLKAFSFRLADKTLPEAAWVESVGSFLCSKPPAKWVDADVDHFHGELLRLARQFQRVEAMTFGGAPDPAGSAIRVAVTLRDGMEVDHVLYVGNDEEPRAAEIEVAISRILSGADRVGLVAASRAIAKLLASMNSEAKPAAIRSRQRKQGA